jgi:thioredoxin-related protein
MGTALKVTAVSLLLLLAWQGAGQCAFDVRGVARTPVSELLVFEQPDCTYCRIFRRDVLPYYRQSIPGNAPPLRFIDLRSAASGEFALKGRIEAVPTAVLMKNGQEVGRIVGYWGREAFFRLLSRMLARME